MSVALAVIPTPVGGAAGMFPFKKMVFPPAGVVDNS